MSLKGFRRNFKPLSILTEEQLVAIHSGTLDVLWETGIRVENERALKLCKTNDCKVDFDNRIVKFPPGLVEDCLRRPPSTFHVKARDPRNDLVIGGDVVYFFPFPGMGILDLDTGQSRTATRREFYEGVRVFDALSTLHMSHTYSPYFGFEGVPPVMSMTEGDAANFRNTSKFIVTNYSNDCEIFSIEMAKAIGMENGGFSIASPPLTIYDDAIGALFRFIEAEFPVFLASGAVFGGTAPATIAGSTVTNNAEVMSLVVLSQLIKPGTRVIVDDFCFPQDMTRGSPAFGAIGTSLHQVVFNQIWRKYGIPTMNGAGGVSSSKEIDFQCGCEKTAATLLAAISGANIIQLHGGIFGEISHHPVQAILDDDLAGMIGRFVDGVKVCDETLAIDLIEHVGPIPGYYLNSKHTREWWRKEQFVPKVADRLTYPEWIQAGQPGALDHAKERLEATLATHKPTPLTQKEEQAVEDILKQAREYYREKGLLSAEEWQIYKEQIESASYPYA